MKKEKNETIESLLILLKSINHRFENYFGNEKLLLIKKIAEQKLTLPNEIIEYHHLLLFLLAYPQSKQLHEVVAKELQRCAIAANKIFNGGNERKKIALTNTGIANTQINVSFSFHLVKWQITEFGDSVKLFSIDADESLVEQVLVACIPAIERDLIADKMFSTHKMIAVLKKKEQSDLEFLIHLFENADCSLEIRDALWDSMKIFVSWKLNDQSPTLTNARSIERKIFFHKKELLKKFDWKKEMEVPISPPYKLEWEEKHQLVNAGRGVLAMLHKEIDPITYADEKEVELFDMGRGIDIALYPMIPSRRLPLESYISYAVFKNRIPVAYGGGWIFLHRSKIGLNIFPLYRGGESALLFCQILRLYQQHYHVKKIIVEPYQFGKRNLEAINSGAYWFYYRLGFRSVKKELQQIADAEYEKIIADKNYRTPMSVLKHFTNSNLELNLSNKDFPDADPLQVAKAIADETILNGLNNKELNELKSFLHSKTKINERDFILKMQNSKKLINVFSR